MGELPRPQPIHHSYPPAPTPANPGYPPYPPPINMNAILSLIFALVVFAPLGVYFGNKAKREIDQTGERGIELATAGVVCGWIFSGLMLLGCAFSVVLFGFAITHSQ